MDLKLVLQSVELFEGLTDDELGAIAAICRERRLSQGEVLVTQGELGEEMFIVTGGFVEVLLGTGPRKPSRVVVNLGRGQVIDEMALLDQCPHSTTVRAIDDPTIVQVIHHADFEKLCQENAHIGYVVMRNMAADLSFKLRHRNLSERKGDR